jgi:AGZA family xanthine/uracil permease-like MFS transporter
MRWLVRGDVDGFFGLAVDNLVQLLLIDALCRTVLGFPNELIYGRVLPGVAVSLLVGNLYYARQAIVLARTEGRSDVCALPYGINTVSLFAHVFLVMLPAKLAASAAGHPDPARVAWQAGLVACLGSGLIEFGGAFVAERLRRAAPRAALLSTLAGIAVSFISHVRAPGRRHDDARHRAPDVFRPCPLSRRAAGRPGCGGGGDAARMADGHRAGGRRAAGDGRLSRAGARAR